MRQAGLIAWVDRLIWKAPWLMLASLGAGMLPGYAWWLATGDAVAAKHVIRVSFPCSLAAPMASWGATAFYLPFLGNANPSAGVRFGYAAVGGMMWAEGAVVTLLVAFDLPLLAAARIATAVFAAGPVLQRRVAGGGEEIRRSKEGQN